MLQKSSNFLSKPNDSQREAFAASKATLDQLVALVLLIVLVPVHTINSLLSILLFKPIFVTHSVKDCLNRKVIIRHFSTGIAKSSGVLWSVIKGDVRLIGMPLDLNLTELQKRQLASCQQSKAGLVNAAGVHNASGLNTDYPIQLLEQQFRSNLQQYILLLIRGLFSWLLFNHKGKHLDTPANYTLFGLKIANDTMTAAVDWAISSSASESSYNCKLGFFINVNSINLSFKAPQFAANLNQSNRNFADGLGMRLAAKKAGIHIKANINGTNMLPQLCKAAVKERRSIYLLGSEPGIAQKAANMLSKQHPGLTISGTAHGYFDRENSQAVIDNINKSRTDILLVALGSPEQERWLLDNQAKLHCSTALAVGGLLDFNAGKVSRAPIWLRELGMEWVWRLLQEPKKKFVRYVIGNPLFMFRTFILNQATRGH
jgi:N-acetylglucosaminyldiphosphoundecaprenol N-acetyl-beta-D-mannosaminyltransferase